MSDDVAEKVTNSRSFLTLQSLNNIMLVGFHVFTGAKSELLLSCMCISNLSSVLNTLSDHSVCTIGFQAVAAIIGVIVSLPRTLAHVSSMGVVSAICMAISILLALIFSGIEPNPRGGYGGDYPALGPVHTVGGIPPVLAVAKKTGELVSSNLTFVDGVNAFLNITFLWIGQILYPSFIAEMREPRDFPKALAALTALEMALFLVVSVVGYYYLGQYAQAPMIGSLLSEKHRKAAFAFVLVPTVVVRAVEGVHRERELTAIHSFRSAPSTPTSLQRSSTAASSATAATRTRTPS